MRDQLAHLPGAFIELDNRFHMAIARATRNPSLEMILAPILRPLHGRMQDSLAMPVTAEQAVAEHERIVATLRAGDTEATAAAMAAHLERVCEEIRMLDTGARQ
jgi:DNA-binding GntR family transcriptional regulator